MHSCDSLPTHLLAGLEMFTRIAAIAEAEGHHPDLHLESYNTVYAELSTHAVGGCNRPLLCMLARQCLVLPRLQAGLPGRMHLLPGSCWGSEVIMKCSLCVLQVVSQRMTSSWLLKSTSSISQNSMLPRRGVPSFIDCCSYGSSLWLCWATPSLLA